MGGGGDVLTSPVLLVGGNVIKCNSNSHILINGEILFPVPFSFWIVNMY